MSDDPNAIIVAQCIAGYGGNSPLWQAYGFPNTLVGLAQTCRKFLHDNTDHSDGPYYEAHPAIGDYAWVYEQLKKKLASDPTAITPQMLCGNYQTAMGTLLGILGIPMGQARICSSAGDMQASGYQLFEDHVLNYMPGDSDGVQDADFGVDYEWPYGGVHASIFNMCWLAPYLSELIVPSMGTTTNGWSNCAGASTIRDRFWFAVHDQSRNVVMFNWNAFLWDTNPDAVFVTSSDLATPRNIRDLVLSGLSNPTVIELGDNHGH